MLSLGIRVLLKQGFHLWYDFAGMVGTAPWVSIKLRIPSGGRSCDIAYMNSRPLRWWYLLIVHLTYEVLPILGERLALLAGLEPSGLRLTDTGSFPEACGDDRVEMRSLDPAPGLVRQRVDCPVGDHAFLNDTLIEER